MLKILTAFLATVTVVNTVKVQSTYYQQKLIQSLKKADQYLV
jgi:hypothetical protein